MENIPVTRKGVRDLIDALRVAYPAVAVSAELMEGAWLLHIGNQNHICQSTIEAVQYLLGVKRGIEAANMYIIKYKDLWK